MQTSIMALPAATDLPHLVVVVPLALAAAASFAVANVVQTQAVRQARAPDSLSPRLLVSLLADQVWLIGLLAAVVGYALQATALFLAPVVLVQPLIVTELLFALPLAAAIRGTRLGVREWAGAGLVAAGISVFVLVGNPTGERTQIAARTWLLTSLCVLVGVAVLSQLAEASRRRPMLRGTALAAAASICFGFMSVLTKVVGHQFDDSGIGALGRPQPWLLAVVAITGLLLSQTAFRIAPLSVSLPVIDVGEPLIGSLLGVLVLQERIGLGPGTLIGVAFAAAAIVAGVATLDTSPRARAMQHALTNEVTHQRAPRPPVPVRGGCEQ
jgi:drug/metabolite transporter (DMT)-like permease